MIRQVFVVDIGGEGRHPDAWNVNPSRRKTFGLRRGQPIPRLLPGRGEAIPLPDGKADVIIVDGGPFLGAASTVQFAHIADAVVLTIPSGRQQKQALALIGRELREQQDNVLAVTTPSAPPRRR